MNSRWQANKIGLINFWYYDEQESCFVAQMVRVNLLQCRVLFRYCWMEI